MSELKRIAVTLVFTLLFLVFAGAAANANERYALGELVVQMAEGESIDIVNNQFGTVDIQHLPQLNVYQVNVGTAQDLEVLAAQIEVLPEVVFCQPNYLIDPLNTVQSSLPVSDELHTGNYLNQPAVQELQLGQAQALSRGANVKVAVLDGGIEYNHPAFAGKAVSGYDYVDDDYDAFDELGGPNSGHGTFVAGVIHLVAPDAEIRSYRVTNVLGESDGYIVAEAILQAVADGCQVINLSMVTMDEHKAIASALQYARDHGVLAVAAAGNGQEESARYPASDANAIGVAAVDSNLSLADFSNFGQYVDICAPGTEIYGPYQDGEYAWWGGTSFAAPFVSGQAALITAMFPMANWELLADAIISTATDIDAYNAGFEGQLGSGLTNPFLSLSSYLCGDLTDDGQVNLGDITRLLSYLYIGAPLEAPSELADIDGYIGLNGNDAQRYFEVVFELQGVAVCGPTLSLPFPTSSTNFLELRNTAVPANTDTMTVELWIDADQPWDGVVFPFCYSNVMGTATLARIDIDPDILSMSSSIQFDNLDYPGKGIVAIHGYGYTYPHVAGEFRLALLHFSGLNNPQPSVVWIDTCTYPPSSTVLVSRQGGLDPIIPQITGLAGNYDLDGDGVADNVDNCRSIYNPDQADADGDGVGDVCDVCPGADDHLDTDLDSYADGCDNCPNISNFDQADADGDGVGDLCDKCPGSDDTQDADGDGVPDGCDNCVTAANSNQRDKDHDGIGDACDPCTDVDGDGYGDPAYPAGTCPDDNCLTINNPDQTDADNDGIGDACDNCPTFASTDQGDYDHDGIGDVCDNCKFIANADQADGDHDGIGDVCESFPYLCGNVDDNGGVTLGDVTRLADYLYISNQSLTPSGMAAADVDGWAGVTPNDLTLLISSIYEQGIETTCPPMYTPPFPSSQQDTIEFVGLVIPPGQSSWRVDIWLTASNSFSAVDIDFSISCTKPGVHVDSSAVELEVPEGCFSFLAMWNWSSSAPYVSSIRRDLVPGYSGTWTAGKYLIGSFWLSNTQSNTSQVILIDTVEYVPGVSTVLGLNSGTNPVIPTIVGLASQTDSDGDGIMDIDDNCPFTANPDQTDSDGDGYGDGCDNCAATANVDQADDDFDGVGDVCDECPGDSLNDPDDDNICGLVDNCPNVSNEGQVDSDGDGVGDPCDICLGYDDLQDTDADGVPDGCDNCPTNANADQMDLDNDGSGDACDLCPVGPASCRTYCGLSGDVNYDGVVNHDDLTSLIDYLYLAGTPPPNPLNADCDDYEGITTRDIMYIYSYINGMGALLNCPPQFTDAPLTDSSIVLQYPDIVEPYASHISVPLILNSPVEVLAFNFPLDIRIGSDIVPVIDSMKIGQAFNAGSVYDWEFTPDIVFRANDPAGSALISAVAFYGSTPLPAGSHLLSTLYLTVQPSSAERPLSMTWADIQPAQPLPLEYVEEKLYPVIISPGTPPTAMSSGGEELLNPPEFLREYGPNLVGGTCCVGVRGDVDGDGINSNLADITSLIATVYLQGPEPVCLEEANVDGDPKYRLNLADITMLIDYVYLSKTPPPLCGESARAVAKPASTVSVSIKSVFEDGVSRIILASGEQLRGVELNLLGESSEQPVGSLGPEMELFSSHENGSTIIGLFDLEGQATIPAGTSELLRIPGEYQIADALVVNLKHETRFATVAGDGSLPTTVELGQNYPNPFNPDTRITFSLPGASDIKVEVYNVLGELVRVLVDDHLEAGQHEVIWHGDNNQGEQVSSGVYFYRLLTPDITHSRKMLLIK